MLYNAAPMATRLPIAWLAGALALAAGCGTRAERPADELPQGSAGAPGAGAGGGGAAGGASAGGSGAGAGQPGQAPTLGAHGLAYFRVGDNPSAIDTPAMATQPSGSTLLVSVGRGDRDAFTLPTDNKGNTPFVQLDTTHPYTNWPGSGTALYAYSGAKGGPSHTVRASTPPNDEITIAAVEVVYGTTIVDYHWNEVLAGEPLTSGAVTTTGPATLVAFWWGDAGVDEDKTAVPDNGFTVIDSILLSGELVQCAVATRDVDAAGSYDVTWTATPTQGAQMWLIAVQ
jgi:hypothetical protein